MRDFIIYISLIVTALFVIAWLKPEEKRTSEDCNTQYVINSIRVDDDGEYHIVAVSNTGKVYTESDLNIRVDIDLRFENRSNAIVSIHSVKEHVNIVNDPSKNYYTERSDKPIVRLPFNYKIETFED